jgi:ActR/RegA family two-component response regulator
MQDYLSKPVRIDDLIAALARAADWMAAGDRAARVAPLPQLDA